MKSLTPLVSKRFLSANLATAAVLSAQLASASIVGPYSSDPFTLHLYHLDENTTPAVDAVTSGGTNLTLLSNGATLTNPSFSGYGTCLSTLEGGQNSVGSGGQQAAALTPLAVGTPIPFTYADPSTSAFTYEALVQVQFDPTLNMSTLANGGNGRNAQCQIFTCEANGNGTRVFQFRIDPIGTASGTAFTNRVQLEFIRVGGTTLSLYGAIPTNGPDAIVSNNWYHVGVTYNGVPNTTSNLLFYWTLADPTRTNATCIMGTNLNGNLVPAASASTDWTIGNTGRNPSGSTANPLNANFLGQVDEVRISSVARAANEMMFADTNVYIVRQPANLLEVVGQPATFTVGVSGMPQLYYQWYTTGTTSTNAIPNATNSSYTIPSTTINDATNYFVIVTNTTGAATSSVVTLTIRTSVNNLAWRGTNSANWDSVAPNWSNTVTFANGAAYLTGDNVSFGNSQANYNVNLIGATFPGSVAVTTDTNCSFGGAGYLGGSMNLTKTGNSTLTLSNANTFTGTVTVNNGTLRTANATALGNASSTTINSGATLDVFGQGLGASPIVVQGNGFNGTNGAINNTGGQQQSAIRFLTLAGDAIFNASAQRWDVYSSGGLFQGNGHKLTKIGTNDIWIKDVGDTGLGDILILRNTLGFQGVIGLGDPTKTITCSNGTFGMWATAPMNLFAKNVVLGNNSAIFSGGAANGFYGPVQLVGTNSIITDTDLTLYGAISGNGGLIKANAANIHLQGTNTYTGSTIINTGGIILDSANASLPVGPVAQLAPGTTLDVSAISGLSFGTGQALIGTGASSTAATYNGNVTATAGSTINPGLNGPGTLNISGSLSLQGATVTILLGSDPTQVGNGVSSYISVGSSLSLSAVNTIQLSPGAPLNPGTYTILTYSAGSLTGGAANLAISSSNPRYTFTLVDPATTPGSIQVTVAGVPAPLVWRGGKPPTPNTWNHLATNWFNLGTGLFDKFFDGDSVEFNDSAATNTATLSETNHPGLTLFTNIAKNFVLNGTGNLAGQVGQEGTGTVTLAISNVPAMTSLTNDAGTFVFNVPMDITNNATISDFGGGLGTIIQASTDQMTLTGSNQNYNGTLVVTNGVLRYSATGALGANGSIYATNNGTLNIGNVLAVTTGTKNIVIQGAGFNGQGAINGGAGGGPVPMMTGSVNLSGNATIAASARWDFASGSTINGNGHTLTYIGPDQTWLITANCTLGDLVIAAGTVGFQQGTSMGDPTATITVQSNAACGLWANDPTSLTKNIVLTNGASLSSGGGSNTLLGPLVLYGPANNTISPASGADVSLYGPISGTGGWVKQRTGVVWLFGTNTYSGSTIIGASSKVTVGPNSSLGSSSTIEIDGGSTLDVSAPASFTLGVGQTMIGNGTVVGGNITFGNGSTLQPGFSGSTYTLTMNGSLTFQPGSTDIVKYNKGTSLANDLVTGLGSVTYGGTLFVTNLGSGTLAATDTLKLFNSASYSGYFANIVPAIPAPGLAWNTNTLTTDGTLRFVVTANLTPTNIVTHLNGNQLTLTWPADHIGWRLLLQTNHLASGISGNTNDWDTVSGSTATNQATITINPANPTEFYRLVYP